MNSNARYPFGRCWKCGQEFNSELRDELNITHCPWCGEKIDDIFCEGVTQESQDHYCEDCGVRIYEQRGKGGFWITRDKNPKQPGVCSGPCERELCAHCGDWDKEGECPKCHVEGCCTNCPVEGCKDLPDDCKNPCMQCVTRNDCLTAHTDKRDECEAFRAFKESFSQYKDDVKTGWWKVSFDITLNGEEIRFEDLSETSQEHILDRIKEGYSQGEVVESIEDEEESDDDDTEYQLDCAGVDPTHAD